MLDQGPQVNVEVTLRGLNQYTKRLDPAVLNQRARESLQDCLNELKRLVVRDIPYASGQTRETIYTEINGTTLQDLNGIVASPESHFRILEYGRKPGAKMPPDEPIWDWMGEKGIEAEDGDDKAALFLIKRAIGRRGLPALHIMRNALAEGRKHFSTIWLNRFMSDWKQ